MENEKDAKDQVVQDVADLLQKTEARGIIVLVWPDGGTTHSRLGTSVPEALGLLNLAHNHIAAHVDCGKRPGGIQ